MSDDLFQISRIAKYYYEEQLTQNQIAEKENISRPTVSRYLKKAHTLGLVQINVVDLNSTNSELKSHLEKKFDIDEVTISNTYNDFHKVAATYINNKIYTGCSIGVSWGETLSNAIEHMIPSVREQVQVVQLLGASGRSEDPSKACEIAYKLANILGCVYRIIPAPLVVSNSKIRDILIEETSVSKVLEIAKNVDIALLGIGTSNPSISKVASEGFVSNKELETINKDGAVGEICCRFYRSDGSIYSHASSDGIIGLDLKDIIKIPTRIGVAFGIEKVEAIAGAMRGKYINSLVTDINTARKLVQL